MHDASASGVLRRRSACSRKLTYASVLAGAIGLPYAISNVESVSQFARSMLPADGSPTATSNYTLTTPTTPTSYTAPTGEAMSAYCAGQNFTAPYPTLTLETGQPLPTGQQQGTLPPLAGLPVDQLGEVLRFDVSPAWVTSRWRA